MAVPDLDPRNGGSCSNCMAHKYCSIVLGWVQLVFWTLGFLTLVFKPSSVSAVVKNADTATMAIAGCLILLCIGFSVILLLGLYKDKRYFVKAFCFFIVVYLTLQVLSFFVNLFMNPHNIGFQGFFSIILCFLLNLVILLVVRSYYLKTYCSGRNEQPPQYPQYKV